MSMMHRDRPRTMSRRQSPVKASRRHRSVRGSLASHRAASKAGNADGALTPQVAGPGREQEPSLKEIGVGAAVHRAFQGLETRDLPLGLPTASRQCQCSPSGVSILNGAGSKTLHNGDVVGSRFAQPFIERSNIRSFRRLRATSTPDDMAEPAAEIDDFGRFSILQQARDQRSNLRI